MAKVVAQRMAAEVEGDFVVFLIGMRINKFYKVRSWWQVVMAMPRMLKELEAQPESGFLGARNVLYGPRMPAVVQYWRSFEDLERYARAKDAEHFPAWAKFNKTIGSNGAVGIWHETYRVAAGQYEAVYNNMPLFGLAAVSKAVPAAGYRSSARGRITGVEAAAPIDPEGKVTEEPAETPA
jgi:hypothetical protein